MKKTIKYIIFFTLICFVFLLFFFLYKENIYKEYLLFTNNLIPKTSLIKENTSDKFIVENFIFGHKKELDWTNQEEKIFNKKYMYKIKEEDNNSFFIEKKRFNNLVLYKKETQEKIFFNKDNVMSIIFIDKKYIFIMSITNTYLLQRENLTILDSFGKKENVFINDIYYKTNNNMLFVLSSNEKEENMYKIDILKIENNKLNLLESISFFSISFPRTIEYIDDNILLSESEIIDNLEGYGITLGIEKYDLNYWRNYKK